MRARAIVIGALVLLATAGCTGWTHGYTTRRFEGRVLPLSSIDGARRFELERGYDRTIADYVQREKPPDYIHVVNRRRVTFIYVAADAAVTFERPVLNSTSVCRVERPIPDPLLYRLSGADVASVRRSRNSK